MTQNATEPLWWQRGVIYQIYPRSFKDNSRDGIGDLKGIISKLDYFSDVLGIDALWLSPFYPSPMADFGYDVSSYVDVDPMFGTLDDFDLLVKEAHQRGLYIIIDFVPNHTSDQHPWFIESRSSRDNPRRDWYVWKDAKADGSPPNNWLANFGGSSWEWDAATGQYYLHSFLKEQPDLNWRNPEVKAAMFDAIRFWLERGVDGFRLDVAHFIMKDPDFSDNPPTPPDFANFKDFGEYGSQLHLYDKGHADTHQVMREFRKLLDSYGAERPRFSVGEIHIFDWPQWALYYGEQLDELHMPYNFSLLFAPWNPQALAERISALESILPAGAWPNYVLGNHDEHRVASRLGVEAARVAMMMLLTLRGTPTIYYGDEIGMHDVEIPPELEQDPWGKRVVGLSVGRDPERTPMQWDSSPNAGFSESHVTPWLPVAEDYAQINVQTGLADPTSMLNLTRSLLKLRREAPALHAGKYIPVENAPADCLAYMRHAGVESYLIVLNFSDQPETATLPDLGTGRVLISTLSDYPQTVDLGNFTLRGNEGWIILLD